MEMIALPPGGHRLFITDWRQEKVLNDGTNYYGSHGRVLKNSGSENIYVIMTNGWSMLTPGQTKEIQSDIKEVT